jgi:hypothetical protein
MQTKLIVGWVVIFLAGLAGPSSAAAQTGRVAVVVNEKNPVNNLSAPERLGWRLAGQDIRTRDWCKRASRDVEIVGYVRE